MIVNDPDIRVVEVDGTVSTMLNALREFRESQGWTLAETSGLTGLSTAYLSLIERHLREPSPAMKVRIARGVGAPLAELFPARETAQA